MAILAHLGDLKWSYNYYAMSLYLVHIFSLLEMIYKVSVQDAVPHDIQYKSALLLHSVLLKLNIFSMLY